MTGGAGLSGKSRMGCKRSDRVPRREGSYSSKSKSTTMTPTRTGPEAVGRQPLAKCLGAYSSGRTWTSLLTHSCRISRCVPSDAQPPLLGIVPWAPVHAGPSALSAYLPRLDSAALPFIKGFRYLLQGPSVPGGAILQEPFVQGLKWCGERGYGFEVTVDCHNEGVEKLAQVVECITRVRAGQDPQKLTRFMICHLGGPAAFNTLATLTDNLHNTIGKPDLAQSSSPRNASQSSFYSSFVASLFQLALLPDVSLKISGLLAEAPADLVRSAFAYYLSTQSKKEAVKSPTTAKPEAVQSDSAPQTPSGDREAYKELKKSIKVYLEPALEAFGDHRLVYGSDFPSSFPLRQLHFTGVSSIARCSVPKRPWESGQRWSGERRGSILVWIQRFARVPRRARHPRRRSRQHLFRQRAVLVRSEVKQGFSHRRHRIAWILVLHRIKVITGP